MKNGLYKIFLDRIGNLDKSKDGIIKFPTIIQKICTSFQISKKQAFEILFLLRDFGILEIIPGHGVRLLVDNYDRKK